MLVIFSLDIEFNWLSSTIKMFRSCTRVWFLPGAEVQPGDAGVGAGQHVVGALCAGEGVRGDVQDVTVVTDDARERDASQAPLLCRGENPLPLPPEP